MNFRKVLNIIEIAIVFALTFSLIGFNSVHLSPSVAYAADDSPLAITAKNDADDSDSNLSLSYTTGTDIDLLARILPSDKIKDLQKVTLTLEIDKTYVSDKPTFVDSEQADRSEFIDDPQFWRFRYHYNNFQAVTVYSLPFTFRQKNFTTPNGAETLIRWSMHADNGETIAVTEETVTAQAGLENGLQYTKWIASYASGQSYDEKSIPSEDRLPTVDTLFPYEVKKEDLAKVTRLSDLASENDRITVHYQFDLPFYSPYAFDNSIGLHAPSTLTVNAQLPEGARLSEDSLKWHGWRYENEATGHITHTLTLSEDGLNRVYDGLDVDFFEAPLRDSSGKPFIHTMTFTNTLDKGLPTEATSDPHTVSVAFIPVPAEEKITPPEVSTFRSSTYKLMHNAGEFLQISPYTSSSIIPQSRPEIDSTRLYLHTRPKRITLMGTTKEVRVLQPLEIELAKIDPRVYLQRIGFVHTLPEQQTVIASLNPHLIGIDASGAETELGSLKNAFARENWLTFGPDIQRYSRLIIRFTPGETVPSFDPRIDFHLELTDEEKARLLADANPGEETKYRFETHLKMRNIDEPDKILSATSNTDSLVVKQRPTPYFSLLLENQAKTEAPYSKCDAPISEGKALDRYNCSRIVHYDVTINSQNTQNLEGLPDNIRVVAFLPNGVEFLRHSEVEILQDSRYVTYPGANSRIEDNFNNTGVKALVIDLPRFDLPDKQDIVIRFNFDADVTIYASESPSDVEVYMSSSVPPHKHRRTSSYQAYASPSPDKHDVDQDTITNEDVLKATLPVHAKLPAELYGRQEVSADKHNWTFQSPFIQPGQPVYTRVLIRNTSDMRIANASVFSVLGQDKDHKLSPTADGRLLPRQWTRTLPDGTQSPATHSAFIAPLTGPIESLESSVDSLISTASQRFIIQYSTTPITDDNSTLINDNWLNADQITDWSAVRAIKLSTREGEAIETDETIRFIMPQKMPEIDEIAHLYHGDQSIASVAVSTNGTSLAEGNETVIRLPRYTVSGRVFEDRDADSIAKESEKPLTGISVTLIDALTGEHVRNLAGELVSGVTDQNGEYSFTDLRPGKYRVQVEKTEKDSFSTQVVSAPAHQLSPDSTSSIVSCRHTNEGTDFGTPQNCAPNMSGAHHFGLTDTFVVEPQTARTVRNIGLQPLSRAVKVHVQNKEGESLQNISFTLTWIGALDSNLTPDDLPATMTASSGEDGRVAWNSLPYGRYELREVNPEGPYIPLEPVIIDVTHSGLLTPNQTTPVEELILVKTLPEPEPPVLTTPPAPEPTPPTPEVPGPVEPQSEPALQPPLSQPVLPTPIKKTTASASILARTGFASSSASLAAFGLLIGSGLILLRHRRR